MQRHAAVAPVGKRPLVGLVTVVRVDDNFFRAVADEVIERKCDQRLLADGNQWLRLARGERAQARAETGAEDKGSSNRDVQNSENGIATKDGRSAFFNKLHV